MTSRRKTADSSAFQVPNPFGLAPAAAADAHVPAVDELKDALDTAVRRVGAAGDVIRPKDLPPLAPFSGLTDVTTFIEELDLRSTILGWSPHKKAAMFRAYVVGDARGVLNGVPEGQAATFDQLRHHLEQAFDAPLAAQTHLMQLASIKQQDNESVLAFSIRVRAMASKLDRRAAPVTPLQLVTFFTNGLKQQVKSYFYANPAPDFESAVLKARGLETGLASDAAASTLKASIASQVAAIDTDSIIEAQVAAIMADRRCRSCGQLGHIAVLCPNNVDAAPLPHSDDEYLSDHHRGHSPPHDRHFPVRPSHSDRASRASQRHSMRQCRHRIDAFEPTYTNSNYFNRMITAIPHSAETGRPNLGCVPVLQVYVSGHPVELLLDSGSDLNVIGAKTFRRLVAAGVRLKLESTAVTATSSGQDALFLAGKVFIPFQVEGKVFNTWFFLSASYEGDLLFSAEAMEHFNLDIQWRARRVHFGFANVMVQMIPKGDHPSLRARVPERDYPAAAVSISHPSDTSIGEVVSPKPTIGPSAGISVQHPLSAPTSVPSTLTLQVVTLPNLSHDISPTSPTDLSHPINTDPIHIVSASTPTQPSKQSAASDFLLKSSICEPEADLQALELSATLPTSYTCSAFDQPLSTASHALIGSSNPEFDLVSSPGHTSLSSPPPSQHLTVFLGALQQLVTFWWFHQVFWPVGIGTVLSTACLQSFVEATN